MPNAIKDAIVDGKKKCVRCEEWKDVLTSFYKDSRSVSGFNSECKECNRAARRKKYSTNEEFAVEEKERSKKSRAANKRKIVDHYGGKCTCCDITDIRFLSVDHINGGGRKERQEQELNGGSVFYDWIIRNNYPDHLQILCYNCNTSRGSYAYCPHTGAIAPEPRTTDERARKLLRDAAYAAYGNKCSNCDETHKEFFNIHHKLGDGTKHREELLGSPTMGFYRFLRDNNYPPDYNILCANCHQCLTRTGFLP